MVTSGGITAHQGMMPANYKTIWLNAKSSIIGISLAVVLASAAMRLVASLFALTYSQTNCVQKANACFTTAAVNAAIQQITAGAATNNQVLITAGTIALNNAITAYNTAIAQCFASG
jgi:hypothetical protein